MKKENLIFIIYILFQIILFIPISTVIKYDIKIDIGVIFLLILSFINFISYIITILKFKNKFILKHSILVILLNLLIITEDLILRNFVMIKYLELIIYFLLMIETLDLIFQIKRTLLIKISTIAYIIIMGIITQINYDLSFILLEIMLIFFTCCPFILYLKSDKIYKHDRILLIFLQLGFFIIFYLYKKFNNVIYLSISEFELLSVIFVELILLFKIINTDIKNELVVFSNAIKNLIPGYMVLFVILYLVGMPIINLIIVSFYFLFFLIQIRTYKIFRKYNNVTFEDLLDSYYIEKSLNLEAEKFNNLRIQTFLHDDILQIIIVIRRWIEDNLNGDGKEYIIRNLNKLNDLIRLEINSFDPKLNNYDSLYDAYDNLIKNLEELYLKKEMFVEFDCDKKIVLSSPYDELIYKCINELLINAFKHSKGYYTNINIRTLKSKVYLTVTNYGDYIDNEEKIEEGNIGLNLIRLRLRQYNGSFQFQICDETSEESCVRFKIVIPVNRRIVNENFINRRS